MPAGFEPGKLYELVYTAQDPVLVGLGPAAVRDVISFLKYGGNDITVLGDQDQAALSVVNVAQIADRALGAVIEERADSAEHRDLDRVARLHFFRSTATTPSPYSAARPIVRRTTSNARRQGTSWK